MSFVGRWLGQEQLESERRRAEQVRNCSGLAFLMKVEGQEKGSSFLLSLDTFCLFLKTGLSELLFVK